MIVVGGYELSTSLSGGNIAFSRSVNQIPDSFNVTVLNTFYNNKDRILIKTEELDKK